MSKNLLDKVAVASGTDARTGFTASRRCITRCHQSQLGKAAGEHEALPFPFMDI